MWVGHPLLSSRNLILKLINLAYDWVRRTNREVMQPEIIENQSFIIRLHLEEIQQEHGKVLWRGSIVQLPGHEQQRLSSMEEILRFIAIRLSMDDLKPEII